MAIEEIPVRLVGLAIQSEADDLDDQARALHKAWLADPANRDKKAALAAALLRFARHTRRQRLIDHANQLTEELNTPPPCPGCGADGTRADNIGAPSPYLYACLDCNRHWTWDLATGATALTGTVRMVSDAEILANS